MADVIPDLWGDEINVDDLSPVIILNTQASNIEKRTKGVIKAELIQRKVGEVTITFFDIKGEAARHRSRLLECRHLDDDVYPVWVFAFSLYSSMNRYFPDELNLDEEDKQYTVKCQNQDEFQNVVLAVFSSNEVRSKISSMIARNNESRQTLDHLIVEAS